MSERTKAGPDQEIDRLQTEVDRLRRERRFLIFGYRASGGLLSRLVIGPRLSKAARRFFEQSRPADPFPAKQSADLVVAIIRRFSAIAVVGSVIACMPIALLIWQNALIGEQNEKLQQQLDQQAREGNLRRQTELFRTIYETAECGTPNCPPLHPRLLRKQAVLEIVELVPLNLDLSDAQFNDMDLSGVDLQGVNLSQVDFSRTNLRYANLVGTYLRLAILDRAQLASADLRGAAGLTTAQLTKSCGDASTRLPKGLVKPNHWLKREFRLGDRPDSGCPPTEPRES